MSLIHSFTQMPFFYTCTDATWGSVSFQYLWYISMQTGAAGSWTTSVLTGRPPSLPPESQLHQMLMSIFASLPVQLVRNFFWHNMACPFYSGYQNLERKHLFDVTSLWLMGCLAGSYHPLFLRTLCDPGPSTRSKCNVFKSFLLGPKVVRSVEYAQASVKGACECCFFISQPQTTSDRVKV